MILPIIVRRCLSGAGAERLFALAGGETAASRPWRSVTAGRLQGLPERRVCGLVVPVAAGFRVRLLGLAGLSWERAGAGLLIPSCASVHTCGMRFRLDLVFLDQCERPLAVHRAVRPLRLIWCRGASAVLEIPVPPGGESAGAGA
jgi:uncharacterized protein